MSRPTAAAMRELAEAVPKSKPRKGPRSEGGLMVVHVWDDKARGLALFRANRGMGALLEAAGVADVARWSTSGRGWVLPDDAAGAALALAESWRGVIVKVKQVGA